MSFYGERLDEAGFRASGSPAAASKLRKMDKNDPNDDNSYNTPEEAKAIHAALMKQLEQKRNDPNRPHAVHINGKRWKEFGTKAHAENVAKKIPGAMVRPT